MFEDDGRGSIKARVSATKLRENVKEDGSKVYLLSHAYSSSTLSVPYPVCDAHIQMTQLGQTQDKCTRRMGDYVPLVRSTK